MMRSLFFKIFISFIGITLFASVSTAFITRFVHVDPYGELQKNMEQHQFQALTQTLHVARSALHFIDQNSEVEAFIQYLQEVEAAYEGRVVLIRDDNTSLGKTEVSAHIITLAADARRIGELQRRKIDHKLMVALPLSKDGTGMTLVGVSEVRSFLPFRQVKGRQQWFRPGVFGRPLGLPIPIIVCIAAIGCFLLARSLTSSIRVLRKATQQMTRGDFSARVAESCIGTDEIADLSQDFNIMAQRTEAVLKAQKQLLRDISHELRSPLTRQNVALELTKQQFPDAEPYLARIAKESNRLNELIDHLLLLTRFEGDVDVSSCEPVKLQELLDDIVRDACFEAASSNRKVQSCLTDITVTGSAEMLRRAFENIIRNGVHYTAVNTTVEVDLVVVGGEALVTVRDQGIGVPVDCLEQIFKPFFRVAKSRNRESGGTGVGLAIAQKAIMLHGGTILARNGKDGGLVVEVRLPVQR